MDYRKMLGIEPGDINPDVSSEEKIKYINFKLAVLGLPMYHEASMSESSSDYFIDLFDDIIKDFKEKKRLSNADDIGINKRLNTFFENYFSEFDDSLKVAADFFTLDHYGLARELSLPPDGEEFHNEVINSYRIKQGILNNPKHDRRTTQGSFHIVEGGLAIPDDKKAVPKETFMKLYLIFFLV